MRIMLQYQIIMLKLAKFRRYFVLFVDKFDEYFGVSLCEL